MNDKDYRMDLQNHGQVQLIHEALTCRLFLQEAITPLRTYSQDPPALLKVLPSWPC